VKITTTTETTTIDFEASHRRRCGSCSLCCKLLPITGLMRNGRRLDKPSNTRCRFQRQSDQGCCSIYARRPEDCELFSCRWLAVPEETAGIKRPDRCHYVIDPMLDEARINYDDGQPAKSFSVVQVWIDPAFPQAAHDPALRAYMLRMAETYGWPTILRWSSTEATAVFPPPLTSDRQWNEWETRCNPEIGLRSRLPEMLKPPL
jgi:hypothetical protein